VSAKYVVEVENRKYEVEVREESRGVYKVLINGREYLVRVHESEVSTAVQSVEAVPSLNSSSSGVEVPTVTAPPTLPVVGAGNVITSEVPGKVLKVLVKEGDRVRVGDTVVTIESMKMELEIKSHKDGVVDKVLVKPGDSINVGDKLITLK